MQCQVQIQQVISVESGKSICKHDEKFTEAVFLFGENDVISESVS